MQGVHVNARYCLASLGSRVVRGKGGRDLADGVQVHLGHQRVGAARDDFPHDNLSERLVSEQLSVAVAIQDVHLQQLDSKLDHLRCYGTGGNRLSAQGLVERRRGPGRGEHRRRQVLLGRH